MDLFYREGAAVVCVFHGGNRAAEFTKSCSRWFPYSPLSIYRICNEITFFIPDIGYLCFFSLSQSGW